MGRLKSKKTYLSLFGLFIVVIFSFLGYFYYWLNHSVLEKNKSIEYYAPHGASFTRIIYDLYKLKIIDNPKLFIFYSGLLNEKKYIKYGTYRFLDNDTPSSILLKLIQGNTIVIKVTLPEGLNIYQISQRFEKYFPSVSTQQWLQYFSDSSFVQQIGLKERVRNIEGFLFPQTYFFDPHPEPQFMIKFILTEFKKNVTQQMFDKAKSMGLTPLQFITLASIVEKETGLNSERRMVSAVYHNRIKKKMRLQADPTVIYGAWDKYMGLLTKKELLTPTLYNTYTFAGLPVGPIASPGIDSFLATLNPANIDAIYFVATGRGGHIFSNNLKEHNKAVSQYIHYLREEKKKKKL